MNKLKELLTDIKQNCKPMKKSKRQHQIDLLEKLLERLSTSDDPSAVENTDWVHRKISQVAGGDSELDSGGLSKTDMLKANNIWTRHASPFLKQGQ